MKVIENECLRSERFFRGHSPGVSVTRDSYLCGDGSAPMHAHEFSELVVVTSGSVTHFTGGARSGSARLGKGDFFVIHPGTMHGYKNPSCDFVLFNLIYDRGVVARDASPERLPFSGCICPDTCDLEAGQGPSALGTLLRGDVRITESLLELIREEAGERSAGSPGIVHDLFSALIAKLSESYAAADHGDNEPLFAAAVKLMKEKCRHGLTVEDVAREIGVRHKELVRMFTEKTGMYPKDFLMDLKIQAAEKMLNESPHVPVLQVALDCGFHDASHLRKALLNARLGKPRAIRKRSRG